MDKSLTSTIRRLKNIRKQLGGGSDNDKPTSPIRVLVTGAAGNIGYALVFMMAQGYMFGANQGIILHLFDLPNKEEKVKRVAMELFEGAFENIKGIVAAISQLPFNILNTQFYAGQSPYAKAWKEKIFCQETPKSLKRKKNTLINMQKNCESSCLWKSCEYKCFNLKQKCAYY